MQSDLTKLEVDIWKSAGSPATLICDNRELSGAHLSLLPALFFVASRDSTGEERATFFSYDCLSRSTAPLPLAFPMPHTYTQPLQQAL